MLDEMERSVHDVLCVVKRVLEGKKLVVGGGAVETALNVYLENFALNLVYFLCLLIFSELILFRYDVHLFAKQFIY
jgi:hypothetical protein